MTDMDECPSCPRCGSSADFEMCDQCGGDGWVESPDEDSWAFLEDELEECGYCLGKGGWWQCLSSYEWCQAHPLPGQEQTRRAA